jgi:hypothetical protein
MDHTGLAEPVSAAAAAIALAAAAASARPGWPAGLATAAAAALVGLWIGGAPAAAALVAAGLAARWAAPRIVAGFPETLSWSGARRAAALTAGGLIGALGLVAMHRLSTFMADPTCVAYAAPPGGDFFHLHYCMTAYAHAAELVRRGIGDVYDVSLVPLWASAAEVPTAAHMAPFQLDRYGYPPQFLVIPLGLSALLPDFAAQRAAWYGLNSLLFAYTLWSLSVWVGPRGGRLAVLFAPLIWLALIVPLQSGNVHMAVFALAVLAMRAISERRPSAGGALLAVATLAKISPGLLGVSLLAGRRWRASLATAGWAAVFSGLALAVIGWGPFDAFINKQLPQIASGVAFDFLDKDALTITTNWSPFSIPFKLQALGGSLDPWVWGPRAGSAFTALAFLLAAAAGLRAGEDRRQAAASWLAILTLAALRSPMAPAYVLTGAVWALLLLAAEPRAGRWLGFAGVGALIGWPTVLVSAGLSEATPALSMVGSLAGTALVVALMGWMLLRRWPALDERPEAATAEEARPASGLSRVTSVALRP